MNLQNRIKRTLGEVIVLGKHFWWCGVLAFTAQLALFLWVINSIVSVDGDVLVPVDWFFVVFISFFIVPFGTSLILRYLLSKLGVNSHYLDQAYNTSGYVGHKVMGLNWAFNILGAVCRLY